MFRGVMNGLRFECTICKVIKDKRLNHGLFVNNEFQLLAEFKWSVMAKICGSISDIIQMHF